MRTHALIAVTYGVTPWYGASLVIPWMGGIAQHLEPMKERKSTKLSRNEAYFSGEEVKHCALLVSQNTRDFYEPVSAKLDSYSEKLYGFYSMLVQHHLLQAVIFDDHVESGDFTDYPVLILPNAACLSANAVERVREYVRRGGFLITTHETSRYDEVGMRRSDFALADVLGVSFKAIHGRGASYTIRPFKLQAPLDPGHELAISSAPYVTFVSKPDVQVLAATIQSEESEAGVPVITINRYGRGQAIYFGDDVGVGYFRWPYEYTRRILGELIRKYSVPPIEVDAPTIVTANAFVRPDLSALFVHLLNLPFASNRMATNVQGAALDELIPIRGITVRVGSFTVASAEQVVARRRLHLEAKDGGIETEIPEILDLDIVRLNLSA